MIAMAPLVPLLLALVAPQDPSPQKTLELDGRVVDMRGEGVPAARVVVTSRERGVVLAEGLSDGDGCFRVAGVPQRPWWNVQASRDGFCGADSMASAAAVPVRITLQEAVTVRGVVRDRAGKPVAGITVRAEPIARSLYGTRSDGITGEDGAFTLAAVPLGFVHFVAVVPGEGMVECRQLVQRDTAIELAASPVPATSLAIGVTGVPAEALAQIRARIRPGEDAPLAQLPPPWDEPRFDATGRMVLQQIPDLTYRVSLQLDGFDFAPSQQTVAPGSGPHRLQFAASEAHEIRLQCQAEIRDTNGKPIVGARLRLRGSSAEVADATSGADGRLTFDTALAAGSRATVYSIDPRWVLDEPGFVFMFGAMEGHMLIHRDCTIDPTQTLQLRAEPGCCARGRLLLPDGRPAAFAHVRMEESRTETAAVWTFYGLTTSDRDGRYAFAGCQSNGNHRRILVEDLEGTAASEPFAFEAPGSTVQVPELKLSPPAVVEGTVVDASRQPAPGIRVWLRHGEMANDEAGAGSSVEVITDRLGRYRFVGVPPGPASLQLVVDEPSSKRRALKPFAVTAGKTQTFALHLPK